MSRPPLRRPEVQRDLPPHRGSAEGRALLVDFGGRPAAVAGPASCRIRHVAKLPAARAVGADVQSRRRHLAAVVEHQRIRQRVGGDPATRRSWPGGRLHGDQDASAERGAREKAEREGGAAHAAKCTHPAPAFKGGLGYDARRGDPMIIAQAVVERGLLDSLVDSVRHALRSRRLLHRRGQHEVGAHRPRGPDGLRVLQAVEAMTPARCVHAGWWELWRPPVVGVAAVRPAGTRCRRAGGAVADLARDRGRHGAQDFGIFYASVRSLPRRRVAVRARFRRRQRFPSRQRAAQPEPAAHEPVLPARSACSPAPPRWRCGWP